MKSFEEIPGPAPVCSYFQAYRLLKKLRSDALGFLLENVRQYGPLLRFQVLGRRQVIVVGPQYVREVLLSSAYVKGREYTDRRKGIAKYSGDGLLTSNGETWKRQRKLIAPVMHGSKITGYAGTMLEAADRMIAAWRPGETIEVDEAMVEITLKIVARSLFHADIGEDAFRIARSMDTLQGMIEANNSLWVLLPAWFPTRQRMRERRAVRALDEIVYPLIRGRRPFEEAEVLDTGDLASILLQVRDEAGKRMSDRQVRDEVVTVFLAGHETTASTLQWIFALLAQHPDVRARVEEEVVQVLQGEVPTAENVRGLTYLEAVIKEVMRLYPPIFMFSRVVAQDTRLGEYELKAGTDVILTPYATHHDPTLFPDPERFDPERFLGEAGRQIDKFAWYPFGGGPRICVGNAFAMMEMLIIVSRVVQKFRLELAPGQQVVPQPGATLRPRGPLRMRIQMVNR